MELEGNLSSVGLAWEQMMLLSPPASASTGGQRGELLSGDSATELGGSCPLGGVTPGWAAAACMAVSSTSMPSKWLVTAPLPVQGGSNFSPGTEIFSKSLKQKAQIPFLSGFQRVPEPHGVKVPLELG